MPTKHPRVFLTMSAETLALLDALAAKLGKNRPQTLRYALKKFARSEGIKPSA
jgi:hypothetical protein